ncbi:MAG: efflux RND transporter permease subunit, partial [Candidatus Sumerlaeota bacterium]
EGAPVLVKHVASVSLGPATRRGILDKEGAEAVGGVVVVRYGENPLEAIQRIKAKIEEISPGLPERELQDGRMSKVTVVPFYDRTGLIHETLGTLNTALEQEILVTILVILAMVLHLRSSILISGMLPLAVLVCFIAMRIFGVDANIVALSGIAIAIGTIVDMGIVVCENILLHLQREGQLQRKRETVYEATREVGGAVLTAVATTVVSFLPVFTMEGAEGKLFKPLAFTKTFALIASILIALFILPAVAHMLFTLRVRKIIPRVVLALLVIGGGLFVVFHGWGLVGILIILGAAWVFIQPWLPEKVATVGRYGFMVVIGLWIAALLADDWMPLGAEKGLMINMVFVLLLVGGLLGAILLFLQIYPFLLSFALRFKPVFLVLPLVIILWGGLVWFGFHPLFGWLPKSIRTTRPVMAFASVFPGLGNEFMPPLDEGAYLLMPTTMPHASVGEAIDVLQKQDLAITSIPEVASAVGKIGRAETPLDPAPLSMIETIINYHPEFMTDESGEYLTFRWDPDENDLFRTADGEPVAALEGEPYLVRGKFARDENGELIPDKDGKPFRLWRPAVDTELNPGRDAWEGIQEPDDIWDRIVSVTKIPGTTSAPRLQPISARLVMLQSGMRAPMGIKIRGPNLGTIEQVGLDIEKLIKEVPSVYADAVNADRIVGKPYIEIVIDRQAIARYGIMLDAVQRVIEVAIGGRTVTMTVEGRERYAVRVRYQRELRDDIDTLGGILVTAPGGEQIPLRQLADIEYVRGPQVIKSEDTFLTGYVLFDKKEGFAETDVVRHCQRYLEEAREDGRLVIPEGVSYVFAGNYQNQLRAQRRLRIVLPMALMIIFLILYFQFHRISTTLMVFSGILVAWAGGFIMLWFYGQPWFLNFDVFGVNMADLFQIETVNLSVAVWVGFLALFGIASDGGVIVAACIRQNFEHREPRTREEVRAAIHSAGVRRARPLLMTTATTVLALIPVLTSTGRGADIMVPMAIPTFGGMTVAIITMFVVPVLYSLFEEWRLRFR